MLVTDGGFDPDGRFIRAPAAPAEVLEELFRHRRFPFLLDEEAVSEDVVENLLTWRHSGFGVHVGLPIAGHDGRALASVAEYIARGPVALERFTVEETPAGPRVTLRASKFHPRHKSDRRTFEPLEFLATLMPHIPGTHEKTVIYYGHTSNRSRGLRKREQGTSRVGPPPEIGPLGLEEEEPASPARRRGAALIRKVYEVDPRVCPKGRSEMKVISFITGEDVIFWILDPLDLIEPDPAPRAPPPKEVYEGVPAALEEIPADGLFEALDADRREVEALDAFDALDAIDGAAVDEGAADESFDSLDEEAPSDDGGHADEPVR